MRIDNPQCPIVWEECDDPGCPGPRNCVLKNEKKLLKWMKNNPKHPLAKDVIMNAFDPQI